MTHLKVVEENQDGGMLVTRKTTILRLIFVCEIIYKIIFFICSDFFLFPQEKLIQLLVTNAIDHM